MLSCLIYIFIPRLYASPTTDSLYVALEQQRLKNGKLIPEIKTVHLLNEIAFSHNNIDSTLIYAQKAWELALQINDNEGKAFSLLNQGIVLRKKKSFDESLIKLFESTRLLQAAKEHKVKAKAYKNIGIIHRHQGKYNEAIDFYIQSLHASNQQQDKSSALNNIAIIHSISGDYEKALDYFHRAIAIEKNLNNNRRISRIYQNIALANGDLGKYETARGWLEKSLTLEEKMVNPMGMAQIYSLQAHLNERNEDYKKALENRFKAINIYKNQKNLSFELHEINNIGVLYSLQKKYKKAIEQFNRSLEISILMGDRKMKKEAYYNLSQTYLKMNNYKESLSYLQQFNALKDSIFNITTSQQIAELEEKYESERKENEIFQLQAENEKQQSDLAKKENFNRIVIIVSILLFLVIVLIFKTYREKMRRNLVESKHQRSLEQQKTLEILKNQEIEMINAIMEVQEKERSRIAEEIHDHLGNNLATIKLFFDTLHPKMTALDKVHQNQYKQAVNLLEKTCSDVRKIATDVASNILTKFGLVAAIKEMVNLIADAGDIKIKVMSYGLDRRLENSIELALFRIIQELMTNILKHSKATTASIQITKHEHSLNIIVEDNGLGFQTNQVEAGMGLKNINSRLEKIKGEIVVDSGKGAGTTVTIDLEI